MKNNTSAKKPSEISDEMLGEFIGYHMKRAFNVIQTDLVTTLKQFDLRMITYSALVLVVENPGLSQTQLAAALDIERPNLVVIIDELEQRGLINRERVPTDRRTYALTSTSNGRQLCKQALKATREHENKLLAGLDETAKQTLLQALNMIRKA